MVRIIASITLLAFTPMLVGAEEKGGTSSQMRLASMVPLNAPLREFRLPQRDQEGKTTSIIEIGVLRRTSDTHFSMEDVKIRLFEDNVEVGDITTPRARFYMEHNLLAGRDLVNIKQHSGKNPMKSKGRGFVYRLGSSSKVVDGAVIPAVPPVWSLLREVTTTLRIPPKSKSDEISATEKTSEKP
ncbi:MAG: hypothetical protein ACI957_001897 [Verrucomicrobiales bacterium]|jgi:hypothetical protein